MKTRVFLGFAAMALLASCSNEPAAPEAVISNGEKTTVLRVGTPETKTVLGDLSGTTRKVYWADGDEIAVNGISSTPLSGISENSTTAEFTLAAPVTAPFNVLYPSSIYNDDSTVILPADQAFNAGNPASVTLPMAGFSENAAGVSLKHLCSVIKLSVTKASGAGADEDELVSVSFKGNAGEQVSGVFDINYSTGILTSASTDVADRAVSISNLNYALDAADPLELYLVVPAREYATGFTVTLTDSEGHVMTKSLDETKTLEAGHIYVSNQFAFEPGGGITSITINNATELIQFATDYNNRVYEGKELEVWLGADIKFNASTSTDFNATGGIGTPDLGEGTNYFHGTFDGQGLTISGLEGTVPVFAYVGESGIVKNFTIDNTCSFSFTHSNDATSQFGAAVGYHKGLIQDVTVQADVALTATSGITKATALGGVVGRITIGTVRYCNYSGAVSVPSGFSSSKKIYVGGITGLISNNGSVFDSEFNGTISFAGLGADKADTSEDKNNPYVLIGGILGYNEQGVVSGCSTKDNPNVFGAYGDLTGTIVNKTTKIWVSALGGIVGENVSGEISNCTNGAKILITIFKEASSDDKARRIWTGGIVGVNRGDGLVCECINNAEITHRSDPRLQLLGGIVGNNAEDGTVRDCSNLGNLSIQTAGVGSYSARCPNFGGIIGENHSSNVSGLHNSGNLKITRTENNAGVEVCMGGVFGQNTAAVDGGASRDITNTGNVLVSYNLTKVLTTYGLFVGGVAGRTTADISNVSNAGTVQYTPSQVAAVSKLYMGGIVGGTLSTETLTISNCENSGEVYFYIGKDDNGNEIGGDGKDNPVKHTDNYLGGILGKTVNTKVNDQEVLTGGVIMQNCYNSGYVHGGNSKKANGTTCYVGGIAAYLAGKSNVTNCSNNGKLLNDQFNNTKTKGESVFEGGIVGFAEGTASDRISISGAGNVVAAKGPRRGYGGGIVGYAEYTDILNSSCQGSFEGGSGYYIGGIAGWLVNSTVLGCEYSGTAIQTSQIFAAGGIASVLDAGSTLDNCVSYLNSITHGANDCVDGDIAGMSTAPCTIKNCHYTGTYGICSDKNYTDGGGNVADL